MNPIIKKTLFVVSVSFNVILVLFIVFSITRGTSMLAFYNPESDTAPYTTAACIISVPSRGAGIVFAPTEFSLAVGEGAAVQFSLYVNRRQMNIAMEPLYDHSIVAIEPTGFGFLVTALNPGTTTLQTLGEDGFRDIAVITVLPLHD